MPPSDEKQWLAAKQPLHLWYHRFARDPRKRRLVVCACARRVLPLLQNDPRAVALIEACERHADSPKKAAPAAWKAVVAARKLVREFEREIGRERAGRMRRLGAAYAVNWASDAAPSNAALMFGLARGARRDQPVTRGVSEATAQITIFRDVFGNPFRPVTFSPAWRTDTAVALARTMYDNHDFSAMPILADALQDAGCDNADILDHCRGPGPHVRGCWVVDLVLGKE